MVTHYRGKEVIVCDQIAPAVPPGAVASAGQLILHVAATEFLRFGVISIKAV